VSHIVKTEFWEDHLMSKVLSYSPLFVWEETCINNYSIYWTFCA